MNYKEIYQTWLNAKTLSEQEKAELASLTDEKDIEYRFGKNLEFSKIVKIFIGVIYSFKSNFK